jgi:hypothetical protein
VRRVLPTTEEHAASYARLRVRVTDPPALLAAPFFTIRGDSLGE